MYESRDLINCPNCDELIQPKAILCQYCQCGLSREHFRNCPSCSEMVRIEALLCRYCHSQIGGAEIPNPTDEPLTLADAIRARRRESQTRSAGLNPEHIVGYRSGVPEEETESSANPSGQQTSDEEIMEAVSRLSSRERAVLSLRFGLHDGQLHTLEEVAQLFDITRELAHQIESKALRRLRHPRTYLRSEEGASAFRKVQRVALALLLINFSGKDSEILRFKWGFGDGRSHTAEEIAKIFGVTTQEVKELEAKALKML
jgi:DNA-directed RNA polymerase specialized sigma24 family protein